MNNENEIMYFYFLKSGRQVNKIPRNKLHKTKLKESIQKLYPEFMHSYSFMVLPDHKMNETIFKVITIFKERRVGLFANLKRFLNRTFGK